MTDLEKQIEQKRDRANAFRASSTIDVTEQKREATSNFFANTKAAQTINKDLLVFPQNYKAVDIEKEYNSLAQKPVVEARSTTVALPRPITQPQQHAQPRPQPKPYDEYFENMTKISGGTTTIEITLPKEHTTLKEKLGFRVNMRGKIILSVAIVALFCLIFLAIYNAIFIGKLKSDINAYNREIDLHEQILEGIMNTQNMLLDDVRIQALVNEQEGLVAVRVVEYGVAKKVDANNGTNGENWFDDFGNFINRLFGGK